MKQGTNWKYRGSLEIVDVMESKTLSYQKNPETISVKFCDGTYYDCHEIWLATGR